MCRSTRRPLLCPNCVNRGHLNDLALRTARKHKQKLLERINWALEVQVCHSGVTPCPPFNYRCSILEGERDCFLGLDKLH